jgi:hypothetical protein
MQVETISSCIIQIHQGHYNRVRFCLVECRLCGRTYHIKDEFKTLYAVTVEIRKLLIYIAQPLWIKITKAFQLIISVSHLFSANTLGILDFSAFSNFSTWKTLYAVTVGIRKMLIYIAQTLSIKVTKAFQLITLVIQWILQKKQLGAKRPPGCGTRVRPKPLMCIVSMTLFYWVYGIGLA